MPLSFIDRLARAQERRSSVVCVGLDPDPERLPPHLLERNELADAVLTFNRAIIDATATVASAYKLNLAFFEALEGESWRVLKATLQAIPDGIITIADGKRGDIGNSARFYAETAFQRLGFDACTVSGYMGRDSVEPFLRHDGRCTFVLVRTSNPGGSDFQELPCEGKPLFEQVARKTISWQDGLNGTAGFVVGATDIAALKRVREIAPSAPLLIPGVGAQGGDAEAVMAAASRGDAPVIVNSSRSILYASSDTDFADAAGEAAESLRQRLQHGAS